ncbi:uncharacterized protein UTRI_04722_B [Ustilago trichophora]|uniref:RING-type domain-containing protein n=1 Tax=Ustilago trichophora TaxID=86804 RepID=A0A5C3EFY6_9BASI|nr:uncharacterized protein UTRI_04722_B [Ustilago trichophora]
MSSLLSFARAGPAHRAPHDEESAIGSGNRWSRPFSNSNSGNQQAVEMSSQPSGAAQTTNNNDNLDIEQGAVRHERGASGRSILSAVSIPSLSALRQRDRDQERRRQNARVQAEQPSTSEAPSGMLTTLGGGGGNPLAAAILPPTNTATASRSTNKKSRSSRREREEAATLFGPNLANYFGSGLSSSGAVSSHGAGVPQPPAATTPISPTAAASTSQPNDANAAADSTEPASAAATADAPHAQGSARRARLGSRGRARGASLSGLSMMSLGAESVTSLGGINTERTNDTIQATGMMQGSTADLIDQLNRDNPSTTDGHIAMSEGVDITTLQRWIQRSTGVSDDASSTTTTAAAAAAAAAATPASYGPPVCTTLQSFVNLKRNTLKLSTTALNPAKPDTAVNLLRTRSSLSVLPTLSYGTAASTPAARDLLPEPTHSLYFEYDCASPYASVQIFIRASRKHGSWINWQPSPSTGDDGDPLSAKTDADGNSTWLAQSGPPPHVLGWPVHVAKLKKGFGVGHTAQIPLHLQYYAPPKPKKTAEAVAGDGGDGKRDAPRPAAEPPTPAAIPETPGFEFNRRLEVDPDDAEEEAAANARHNARTTTTGSESNTVGNNNPSASLATEGDLATAQPVIEEESKEQRLAREKAERETLKLAIVVEALDENARPLREPNLQTSYLRLTSLPVKKSVAERLAELTTTAGNPSVALDGSIPAAAPAVSVVEPRTWTSQVEGQEAEIGPHRFQLQELYGLSSKPPAVAPAAIEGEDGEEAGTAPAAAPMDMEASNGSECLICLSSPPTTLLLPCTHGLCLECAVQLRDSVIGIRQSERRRGRTPRRKYACPVCRRAYTSMLHLSKADEKSLAQQIAGSSR